MSLYHALKAFSQKDRIRFHIPGHKGGRGLDAAWARDAFSLDVTEFDETDDLQHPSGILKEAQESAAKAFSLLLLLFVRFTVLNCFLTHM